MRSRLVIVLILISAAWLALMARAGYLQLGLDRRLAELERKRFETVVTLNPRRGDITDRNGHELAISVRAHSLFADPKMVRSASKAAKLLAPILESSEKQIRDRLNQARERRFVWIERRLSADIRDRIKSLKLQGFGFIEESKRVYPNDRLMAQALGFVGASGEGLEGLERHYNDALEGKRKRISLRRDARGRPLIVNGQVFNQAPDGDSLQLTVDRDLQFTLEQELINVVDHQDADGAIGVILDPRTSEVLAMANVPTFDANQPQRFRPERRRNRAITDPMEPGSTAKAFVLAAAVEAGVVQPGTKIDTGRGRMQIGRRTIRESDTKHKWPELSVSDILAFSSNVGTARIGLMMGAPQVRKANLDFGFGERTGIDLPGESRGLLQPLPWGDHLTANISFGHGVAATALQIANAYAAIANGGWLRTPYLVKETRDHEGKVVERAQPRTVRRVLSEATIAKLRLMLTNTTLGEGTGVLARVAGFPVAGKTGTAQKAQVGGRGYVKGAYLSSFVGYLPANDPRFVIYIAVDHPRREYYGSAVAAPVFARVAQFAVQRAGLEPVLLREVEVRAPAPRQASTPGKRSDAVVAASPEGVVPPVVGRTAREALRLHPAVSWRFSGYGVILETDPPAGASLEQGQVVQVKLGEKAL